LLNLGNFGARETFGRQIDQGEDDDQQKYWKKSDRFDQVRRKVGSGFTTAKWVMAVYKIKMPRKVWPKG
jgi:hypothetical protein